MDDQKIIIGLGAGTALSGANNFISGMMPVLNALLILAQIAIAVGTAWLLWKKLKKKNDSEK